MLGIEVFFEATVQELIPYFEHRPETDIEDLELLASEWYGLDPDSQVSLFREAVGDKDAIVPKGFDAGDLWLSLKLMPSIDSGKELLGLIFKLLD